MKIGSGSLKDRLLKYRKSIDVPLLNVVLVCIEVDAEVEIIRGYNRIVSRSLQDIESFKDQHLGQSNGLKLLRHDVIQLVRVDGHLKDGLARLQVCQKSQHAFKIIAFGEPLATHQVPLL